jgi:hypothetical protein
VSRDVALAAWPASRVRHYIESERLNIWRHGNFGFVD